MRDWNSQSSVRQKTETVGTFYPGAVPEFMAFYLGDFHVPQGVLNARPDSRKWVTGRFFKNREPGSDGIQVYHYSERLPPPEGTGVQENFVILAIRKADTIRYSFEFDGRECHMIGFGDGVSQDYTKPNLWRSAMYVNFMTPSDPSEPRSEKVNAFLNRRWGSKPANPPTLLDWFRTKTGL